jgi:hypothetical protein
MHWWQFCAALDGYMRAHGQKPKSSGDIPDDVLRDMGIEGFV